MPRTNTTAKGVLGNLKSRLGFSDAQEEFDDEYYGYEDGEAYDEEYDDYEGGYGNHASDTYRYDNGYAGSPRNRASGSRGSSVQSNLVSIDDVRANTQIPDSLKRDPLPPRSSSGSSSGAGRFSRQVERAADYMRSTETSDLVTPPSRSGGVDSLFSSTPSQSASSKGAFDPYDAYEGAGTAAHSPTRALSVLKPSSYGEAERVAKVLKAGDVVILSLKNTPDHLSKRLLDFAFGVASALDANVECIADKVFVILRGQSLTANELSDLRNQGVL